MKIHNIKDIQLLDTQIEFLQNVNQRLAELTKWESEFVTWRPLISKTFNEGIALGAQLRALGTRGAGEEEYNLAFESYAAFIRNYESLWLEIQRLK